MWLGGTAPAWHASSPGVSKGVGGGKGEGVERGQRGGAGAVRRGKAIFSSVF